MRFRSQLSNYLLATFLMAFLFILLVWPVAGVVISGFMDNEGITFFYFKYVFTAKYLSGFKNSFLLALASTFGCMLIAMPVAWVMHYFEFPLKRLFSALMLVPMIMPPFVGALGMRRLFAPSGGPVVLMMQKLGIIASDATPDFLAASPFLFTVILIVLGLYPIMLLNIQAALANVDPAMEEAARNLGASRLYIFFRILLPLIRPGLFAGSALVFIWSFTELGAPLLVGFHEVAAVQIFNGLAQIESNPQPYALVVILMLFSILIYALGKWMLGQKDFAMTSKATSAYTSRALSKPAGWLIAGSMLGLVLFASLPHIGVILLAFADQWRDSILPQQWTFKYLSQILKHPITGPSIVNSLKYASLATMLDIVLGLAIGWVIVRSKVWFRGWLDALAMLPLAVPGLVMAFGYLSITRRGSLLEFMDPGHHSALAILVIAYGVRRLPYVVRSVVAGLEQTSVTLDEAALNLGASRFMTFSKITLPLITANLIAGGLLAFSFAMLEVSDSLILAFRQADYPIAKAIYALGLRLGDGHQMACALGVFGMLLLIITFVGATRMMGRKMGALFRV